MSKRKNYSGHVDPGGRELSEDGVLVDLDHFLELFPGQIVSVQFQQDLNGQRTATLV
jgi:hypothetical protein